MKTIRDAASSRGCFDHGWLKTCHTFSFADYYNPSRMHFGALRVLNDDIVAPSKGFGTHPHQNMEVITLPLSGYLRHGDSEKNQHTISPGVIQVMSAGSGIYHSEYNGSDAEPVEFLQIWVFPRKKGTPPKYENHDIRPLLRKNEFSTFLSPGGETPASILQDAWFSLGEFDRNEEKTYSMHKEGQGLYVFVIEGQVGVDGEKLRRRDGMGIWETDRVHFSIGKGSRVLLMEVPML